MWMGMNGLFRLCFPQCSLTTPVLYMGIQTILTGKPASARGTKEKAFNGNLAFFETWVIF
jgi:hypothetical protein